ncbi:glycosyltransferase family 2 protein [Microbacterium sp. YJN-G]|uniref:glycosyltransferase family 2 protein n=1 Tax=Microbacterium sp. YJN-G TaxID=2763257 RepID=UPI001D0CB159|nr:glycosyltransferase family A protein [Microbacterium sp. YJN-G]
MIHPTVSVVIPAYNNAATIGETIDSILAQRDVEFELIIADHSSTDTTRIVMDRYRDDHRVTLLDTAAGGGAERNWNRVTSAARGEYIKLVCGDDVLRPDILSRQVRLLRSADAVLTACRRDVTDANGKILIPGWGLRGLRGVMPGARAAAKAVRAGSNLFGEPASVLMRRTALEETGGWYAEFPYLIDQATYTRVLLTGTFVADDSTGATFRMSDSQWSAVLIGSQAKQARRFHAWARATRPDVISTLDVAIGDVRATVMAYLRRLSYVVLGWRSR